MAVPAPEGGIVVEYLVEEGDTVALNAPLFTLDTSAEAPAGGSATTCTVTCFCEVADITPDFLGRRFART